MSRAARHVLKGSMWVVGGAVAISTTSHPAFGTSLVQSASFLLPMLLCSATVFFWTRRWMAAWCVSRSLHGLPSTNRMPVTCLIGFLEDMSICAHPCSHPLCLSSAGEVKARCGTSFYKNVMYPFVKMYDPEDSHNLSIWVCGAPVLTHILRALPTSSTFNPFHIQVVVQHHPRIAALLCSLCSIGGAPPVFHAIFSAWLSTIPSTGGIVRSRPLWQLCRWRDSQKQRCCIYSSLSHSLLLSLARSLPRAHAHMLPQTQHTPTNAN